MAKKKLTKEDIIKLNLMNEGIPGVVGLGDNGGVTKDEKEDSVEASITGNDAEEKTVDAEEFKGNVAKNAAITNQNNDPNKKTTNLNADTSFAGGKPVSKITTTSTDSDNNSSNDSDNNSSNESVNPRMSKENLLEILNKNNMPTDKNKKLLEKILKRNKGKSITESRVDYGDTVERMLPRLEQQLHNHEHSLGTHPIFPDDDETNFEEKIVGQRFLDVVNAVKRSFGVHEIDNNFIMQRMGNLVGDSMETEEGSEKELVALAIRMVVEEYNIPDGLIDFDVELTKDITLDGTNAYPSSKTAETEFDNHEEIELANKEVYKRRFINAMTQGAAKKSTHMFHLVDDELSRINPTLPNKYAKMMSAADYMYYTFDNQGQQGRITGGTVKVEFPKGDGESIKIIVRAMVFPLLIHELVKGVMEVFAAHGLPEDEKIQKWALSKADFVEAEEWDMRLGPGLWSKFTALIPPNKFNLKHYIYTELVALPVDEFNHSMREILSGTNEGKDIIKDIISDVERGLTEEEFEEEMEARRGEDDPGDSGLDDINLSDYL